MLEETFSRETDVRNSSFFSCRLLVDEMTFPVLLAFKETNEVSVFRSVISSLREEASKLDCLPMAGLRFIGPVLRQVAKREKVNFLDLAGNFYFRQETVHIERVVDKNPFTRKIPLQNLFSPAASRVSRVLLNAPKRAWRLSSLAAEASVSLGMAHKVIEKMLNQEITARDGKKIILTDAARLLDAWTEVYPKYKRSAHTFFSMEKTPEALLSKIARKASADSFALSFRYGANLAAPFLRGLTTLQFYIKNNEDIGKWREVLDLHEVESGQNLEIYVPYDLGVFYGVQTLLESVCGRQVPLVSDVQLYLDTLDDSARGEELARRLRETRLKF
ncbi:MAG: hypothetical protein LBS35_06800 [Synergistaceae bacterium]|nr:hypothetical protein [Synergistaceae bacterium]